MDQPCKLVLLSNNNNNKESFFTHARNLFFFKYTFSMVFMALLHYLLQLFNQLFIIKKLNNFLNILCT